MEREPQGTGHRVAMALFLAAAMTAWGPAWAEQGDEPAEGEEAEAPPGEQERPEESDPEEDLEEESPEEESPEEEDLEEEFPEEEFPEEEFPEEEFPEEEDGAGEEADGAGEEEDGAADEGGDLGEGSPPPEPAPPVEPPPVEPPPAEPEAEEEIPESYREQLEADDRPIPHGMGALFVPAMTDSTLEPAVDVFEQGSLVESSPVGRKIFLPPGRYTVRVGRGNRRVRPFADVEVHEAEVAVATPTWSALVIDVVDDRNIPHRGSYDLIRLDTRETVGNGRGADRRTGEGLRTWLLIPGTYKIVRPGGTYRERVDYVTVRVSAGEVTQFRLVMDPGTGTFRGGGVQVEGDEALRVGGLELRGTLGGSVEFTHRYNSPESDEGAFLGGDAFLDLDMLYDVDLNYFWLQLQVEAGARYDFDDDWRKTLDFLDLAAIYIMQLHPMVGPYIRASYDTHMMPVVSYFEDSRDVVLRDVNGEEERRVLDVDRVDLGPVFSLHDIRQGIGVNARPVRSYWIDLDLRLGFGFQQLVTRELYVPEDDPDEEALVYQRLDTFTHREGLEFGIVAAGSLTGWLSYSIEAGILEPFTDFANPVLDLDVLLTLRLWSFASLNYLLRLRRDVAVVDDVVINQAVLLRFAWSLF